MRAQAIGGSQTDERVKLEKRFLPFMEVFCRKLHELGSMDFARELDALVKIDDSYKWVEKSQWGISGTEWNPR